MKKWLILAPIGAAAIGAAALALTRKPEKSAPKAAKAADKNAPAPAVMKNVQNAAYSFASGYKDAKTVEVSFDYDGVKFAYELASENFLSDTGDSHVGILYGDDFGLQVEYAAYYHGEDFAALTKSIAERYNGFGTINCGGIEGIKYFDGGDYRMAFPAEGASSDYVLFSAVIKGDEDEEYLKLPDNEDLKLIMNTLKIKAE